MGKRIAFKTLAGNWGLDDWPTEIHVNHEFANMPRRKYIEEPVRCYRCKHAHNIGGTSILTCSLHTAAGSYAVDVDGFCSWGRERDRGREDR